MVETIADAEPFLRGLVDTFKSKVSSAFQTYKNTVTDAENAAIPILSQGPLAASNYLASHPVYVVAYSPNLLNLLSEIRDNAIASYSNKFSNALVLYNTVRTNASLDFTQVINDSYTEFNDAISTANITDENFAEKYETYSGQLTSFLDEITSQRDAFDDQSYSRFLDAFNSKRSEANRAISDFISNRPIIRFTGKFIPPADGIVYDSDNTFSFELENVGGAEWTGTITLKVRDEYWKEVSSDPVSVSPLAPGSKNTYSVSVYIPKVMQVTDKTTGELVERNFGKT